MFTYSLSIFLTSTAFVDTKCKIRHISFEICRIFENCPLEYTPFENGFLYGASVHNQSLTRGKNLKKKEPQHANCVLRLSTGIYYAI